MVFFVRPEYIPGTIIIICMKHSYRIFIIAALTLLLTACGVSRKATFSKPENVNTAPEKLSKKEINAITGSKDLLIETGVASWYGPNFHGKLTANGETYDMDGITAAHRTLPFGSILMVENLDNGKTITLRVNDRGPYAKDRIIDLSRGAAKELGVIGPGTANVKLYLLEGDIENSRITDIKVPNYTIQLGSYKDMAQARNRSAKINESRIETIWVETDRYYRVYFGKYTDLDKAKKDLKKLQRSGHKGFVKQIEND